MISAIVLIDADPPRIGGLAEELVELQGVHEVYSVTGRHDLVALVRVRDHDDLATVVTDGIARLDGIRRTSTLVAFRVYRDEDYEWEIT